ncbi:MAG TPA: polysaccharide deacetylase family protein [Solirubrobacterales bacterium]|nr:polysaccharide deacetylase family protein [Solirubrobacterales bacterium]
MPSATHPPADLHRRRRLTAIFVAVILGLTTLIVAIWWLSGAERVMSGVEGAGPSPAARAWALDMRRRTEDTASLTAIEEAMRVTPAIRHGGGSERLAALTFDDGPSQYTPEILEVLDRKEVRATFFVIGGIHDTYGALIKDLLARGHAIANHTVGHPAMDGLTVPEQAAEIDAQSRAIMAFGAARPRLFRPPYNAWNESTLEILERREMLMVLWSVETNDWLQPGPDEIVKHTLDAVEPGSIVLMHDGGGDRTQTVEALPGIIEGLHEDGYELVTIPELLERDPPLSDQR